MRKGAGAQGSAVFWTKGHLRRRLGRSRHAGRGFAHAKRAAGDVAGAPPCVEAGERSGSSGRAGRGAVHGDQEGVGHEGDAGHDVEPEEKGEGVVRSCPAQQTDLRAARAPSLFLPLSTPSSPAAPSVPVHLPSPFPSPSPSNSRCARPACLPVCRSVCLSVCLFVPQAPHTRLCSPLLLYLH